MNSNKQIARFETFRTGWRRKSAMILDDCGLSPLHIWWRCWGMTDQEYKELWDWYIDSKPGEMKHLYFDHPQPPTS